MWLTLVPAYGRDYKTVEEVLAHWNADKDFLIQDVSSPHNNRYINRQDAEAQNLQGTTFKIRYEKLTNFAIVVKKNDQWVIVSDTE